MRVVKEGLAISALLLLLFVVAIYLSNKFWFLKYVSAFLFLLLLLVLNFFRDPYREVVANPKAVYSPADGTIFDIKEENDFICVKIFMNVLNVHIQRSPVEGVVEKIKYKKGSFNPAGRERTDYLNEQNLIEITDIDGKNYKVLQIAGILARRIVCLVKEKEKVVQGQKIGYILLGSQVNFSLPKTGFKVLVSQGQKVFAGMTPIAEKL